MKLLFKQRFFSWFDSYDIYNEEGDTVYTVKVAPSWGHWLMVCDALEMKSVPSGEKVLSWLPKLKCFSEIGISDVSAKELTLFKPKFIIDCNGWQVDGDFFEWDYSITDSGGQPVASVSKSFGI